MWTNNQVLGVTIFFFSPHLFNFVFLTHDFGTVCQLVTTVDRFSICLLLQVSEASEARWIERNCPSFETVASAFRVLSIESPTLYSCSTFIVMFFLN